MSLSNAAALRRHRWQPYTATQVIAHHADNGADPGRKVDEYHCQVCGTPRDSLAHEALFPAQTRAAAVLVLLAVMGTAYLSYVVVSQRDPRKAALLAQVDAEIAAKDCAVLGALATSLHLDLSSAERALGCTPAQLANIPPGTPTPSSTPSARPSSPAPATSPAGVVPSRTTGPGVVVTTTAPGARVVVPSTAAPPPSRPPATSPPPTTPPVVNLGSVLCGALGISC